MGFTSSAGSEARTLAVHAVVPGSQANGPGLRFVVWVQGCDLGCPGCFNPETHAFSSGQRVVVGDLIDRIATTAATLDGVTISGGEPMLQPKALLELVHGIRARTSLSIILFSGFSRAHIEATELGPAIVGACDVLIDGRYRADRHAGAGLRGSDNQVIHRLTRRVTADELAGTPAAEVLIDADGTIRLTGVDPIRDTVVAKDR